jgi:hypothetical protein
LLLRHPETSNPNQANDKLDEIVKLLSDERAGEKAEVILGGGDSTREPRGTGSEKKAEQVKKSPEPEAAPVAPAPTIATVRVPVAKEDIAPNTTITNDLVAEAFELKELPKDYAGDAVTDFSELVGRAFKTGVAKNQWVTRTMVGLPESKPSPHDAFSAPKPGPQDPAKPAARPVVKKNYHDVAVHTSTGTVIHRYEEYEPGKWRKIAELNQAQAARESGGPSKPDAGEKKSD